jgi:hypothetical protein
MTRRMPIFFATVAMSLLTGPFSLSAATVNYSGKLFSEAGPPVSGGEVVIGTFAASFDPFQYSCVYGDGACNLDLGAFNSAVGEGNFFPIGSGAITGTDGFFSGTGTTSAPSGTPIWMFAFEDLTRDSFYQVLTTSSHSAWQVPAQPSGITEIVALQANTFVMGFPEPEGIRLNVVPFPEPGTFLLLTVVGMVMGLKRQGR